MLTLDKALYSIVQLIAGEDEDGGVYGWDRYSVEEVKKKIIKILKDTDLSSLSKEVKS